MADTIEHKAKMARTDDGDDHDDSIGILPPTYVEGFHDEEACRKMPYRKLYPFSDVEEDKKDVLASVISMGASAFGGVFHDVDGDEVTNCVLEGLKNGMNIVDTAHWYGHGKSEERLGIALKEVPRKAYYLHTKCCRYDPDVGKMFDFSAERTLRAVDESIARIGCEYLDVMQIHDPEYCPSVDILIEQTLPALQKAKDAGKIKRIGITGYPLSIHKEIVERSKVKIDTSLVYCHYSLNETSLVDGDFLDYLEKNKIACINASPLSMGLLTERGPPAWHPAPAHVKKACSEAASYCKDKGVNISKLAVEFTLSEKRIPTTLVSTASISRMKKNIAAAQNLGKLSELESQTLKDIREKYFVSLENPSWENVEVEQYKVLKKKIDLGETNVGTISTL